MKGKKDIFLKNSFEPPRLDQDDTFTPYIRGLKRWDECTWV